MTDYEATARMLAIALSEQYIHYLVAIHKRPVYRHENGDIHLSSDILAVFLDDYEKEGGKDGINRAVFFHTMLKGNSITDKRITIFLSNRFEINKAGIEYMNSLMEDYGDMVEELNLYEEFNKFGLEATSV